MEPARAEVCDVFVIGACISGYATACTDGMNRVGPAGQGPSGDAVSLVAQTVTRATLRPADREYARRADDVLWRRRARAPRPGTEEVEPTDAWMKHGSAARERRRPEGRRAQ